MLIDICANLLDNAFPEQDLPNVLARAEKTDIDKIIIACSTVEETVKALQLCEKHKGLFCTTGIHPLSVARTENLDASLALMETLVVAHAYPRGKIVAFGELGLDSVREEYASLDKQQEVFYAQLRKIEEIAGRHGIRLPLLLHCRESSSALLAAFSASDWSVSFTGVVHSFDGSLVEAEQLLARGFQLGLNGCSFKKETNLTVVAQLPLHELHVETDAPYCGLANSYAGSKFLSPSLFTKLSKNKYFRKTNTEMCTIKGRNEPCNLSTVVSVLLAVKNEVSEPKIELDQLKLMLHENSTKMFFGK